MGSHPIVLSGSKHLEPKIKSDPVLGTPSADTFRPTALLVELLDRRIQGDSLATASSLKPSSLHGGIHSDLRSLIQSAAPATREKIHSAFNPSQLKTLYSLGRERDPRLFYQDLFTFGQECQQSGDLHTALLVFQSLSGDGAAKTDVPSSVQKSAELALALFAGEGPRGEQLVLQMDHLVDEVASPVGIASMGVAGLTYGSVRLATFEGLKRVSVLPWLTKGLGAHGLAFAAGLGAESAAFVGTHRGINALMGKSPTDETVPWTKEYLATALLLGLLKVSGGFTRSVLGKAPAAASWWQRAPHVLLPQASMFASILGSQYLEAKYIWDRPAELSATNALVSLIHFNAAGKVMEQALGRPYADLMGDLNRRGEILKQSLSRPLRPDLTALTSPMYAMAGGPKEGPETPDHIILMNSGDSGRKPPRYDTDEPTVVRKLPSDFVAKISPIKSASAMEQLHAKLGNPEWLRGISLERDRQGSFFKLEITQLTPEIAQAIPEEFQGIRVKVDALGEILSKPELEFATISKISEVAPEPDSDFEFPSLEPEDMRKGEVVSDKYIIEDILGYGGMGVVYKAQHTLLEKPVAIKSLYHKLARYPLLNQRFLMEAKTASSLRNPHIIEISDFGTFADGTSYYVMEFLEGKSLESSIKPNMPLEIPRIIDLAQQMTLGIKVAHDKGIIHRDLKPDNIFITKGGSGTEFVKILDFGLAKVMHSTTKLTIENSGPMGTAAYMAPEQSKGEEIDQRADIYAMGAILYQMATGKLVFNSENPVALLGMHQKHKPTPLQLALDPAVAQWYKTSPGLEAIIMKCLEKEPDARYQSMQELYDDLELLRTDRTPLALMNGDSSPPKKMTFRISDFFKTNKYWQKGPPWKLIGGTAGILALGGLGGYLLSQGNDGSETQPVVPTNSTGGNGNPPIQPTQPAPPASGTAAVNPTPEPKTKDVILRVNPPDAHVYLNNVDLGKPPIPLSLEKDETMTLEIRRRGYKTESFTIDGSEAKVSITLKALGGGTGPRVPVKPPPTQPTAKPGDWNVKPWD